MYFVFNGQTYQTNWINSAELEATWNEKFKLTDIQDDSELVLEVWDKDWVSSDYIGQTDPIKFATYAEGITEKTLKITDEAGADQGEIKFTIDKQPLASKNAEDEQMD